MSKCKAAIRLKIGKIGCIGILDENSVNSISKEKLKKISSYHAHAADTINLNITIDRRKVVNIPFKVKGNCGNIITLGKEFFYHVEAHLYMEHGLIKWIHKDDIVYTDLIFKGSHLKKKKSNNTDVVTIMIYSSETWDGDLGGYLFNNCVYSLDKKILLSTTELLDYRTKTPTAYYLEAVHYAFKAAIQHELEKIHIVLDNEEVHDIMTRLQKQSEKDDDTADDTILQFLEVLSCPTDFEEVSNDLKKFKFVKFGFIPTKNQFYKKIVRFK